MVVLKIGKLVILLDLIENLCIFHKIYFYIKDSIIYFIIIYFIFKMNQIIEQHLATVGEFEKYYFDLKNQCHHLEKQI
jgi:hypothetical protein